MAWCTIMRYVLLVMFSLMVIKQSSANQGGAGKDNISRSDLDLEWSDSRRIIFPEELPPEIEGRSFLTKSECDAHIRDKEGWIFTPNYPSDYGNNRVCYYVIERYTGDTCHVEMTLDDFDLEESESCLSDYLDLRDGQQGVLCGSLASGTKKKLQFRAGQATMTLRFKSDSRNTRKGFMIKLKQIPRSCGRPSEPNVCNQYIDTFTGAVTSPGYPHGYDPNLRCAFTIRRADPRICKVLLEFRNLDFGPGADWPCTGDYLEFPNLTKMCQFRTARKTLDFERGSDLLTFYFVSDGYGSGKGFDIEILQVPDSCGLLPPPPDPGVVAPCDQTISALTGQFTSPGYPMLYGPNERCRFTIHKVDPSVCSIELEFRPFEVEYSGPECSKDYLTLPTLSRLCGSISGKRLVEVAEDNDYVNMYFVSDERRSARGFRIYVTQLLNTCPGRRNPDICAQEVTTYSGIFTSPGFPTSYPPNQRCIYTVRRADPTVCTVELTFIKFDLEYSRDHCSKDFLMLPDRSRLCGITSGTRILKFPAGSDIFSLNFISDDFNTGRGFQIKIDQKRNSCSRNTADCNMEITAAASRITSPGYPRYYTPGLRCQYKIRRPDTTICTVEFDFRNFDVPSSPGCSEDYLELPDKTRLCGPQPSSRVLDYSLVGNDIINLNFVTDSIVAGKGFDIVIRQLPNSCGISPQQTPCDVVIDDETVILRSPGYPDDYPPNSICVYTVQKFDRYVCQVELQFIYLDVEDSNDCVSDYLLIESTEERICGAKSPFKKVISFKPSSNVLRIVFASDLMTERKGFEIKIRQIRNSCFRPVSPAERVCERYTQATGFIQSQNFPHPYLPNTECVYKIVRVNPSICQLELYFSHFEIADENPSTCDRDYLEVKGAKYCGKRDGQRVLVDFPASDKEVKLHFKTDSYEQRSGFRIEFKQLSSGCATVVDRQCDQTFSSETFQIISPGYQTGAYLNNIDCQYTVKKSSFKVCALQVKFYTFDLEESEDCTKDYLQIEDQKLCGRLEYDSVRTYEFLDDETAIKFHSDFEKEGAGFFLLCEQKVC